VLLALGRAQASHLLLRHPSPRVAYNVQVPRFTSYEAPPFHRSFRRITAIGTQTARGGQAVQVTATDGSHYTVKLSYTSNTLATSTAEGANGQGGIADAAAVVSQVRSQSVNYPQPIGTVRAYGMSRGRVGIIVDGSTPNTELTINPLGEPQRKGYAHSFAYGESTRNHILNIGQLTINSGKIGAIEGFQDAVLSGPLVASATTSIDRIAFDALLPGASITTGGDLNTLDLLNSAELSGPGTGIFVGRDLNLLNVGGNVTFTNGAVAEIGRNFGVTSQPPKGTGTGSNVLTLNFTVVSGTTLSGVTVPPVGSFIVGDLFVAPGSIFSIGGAIFNTFYVQGALNAGFSPALTSISLGTLSRLTVSGNPAGLLQRRLSSFPLSMALNDQNYVTALGGFS
jgi:hypothetical protein